MTAPTVAVTVDLSTLAGVAVAGVTVRARLDRNEVYEGIVISTPAEAVTNSSGVAVLHLFPNAPPPTGLGTQGSIYVVTAVVPRGRSLNVNALVPNTDCRLENVIVAEGDAVPTLDAAQLALMQVQAAATGVATSAAAAATSAASASNSASSAELSAVAAAASAEEAAISFDSFDDKYLGSKPADPTTDNDGAPLLDGALYWNSISGSLRAYRQLSSGWIPLPASDAADIAFRQASTGAVQRDVQSKLRDGWLTPEDFGAVGDGVTDDDAAIRKWAAAVGRPLKRIPGGKTYKCNPATPYDFQPGDHVIGDGMSSLIDASGGTLPSGGVVFRMAGALAGLGKILAPGGVGAGVVTIPLTTVAGIGVGDVLCIHNNTSWSWSAWRAEYHAGEFVEVGRIVGNTVYATMPLWDSYPDTVDIYKVDTRGGFFGNFRIKTQAAQIVGWQFDGLAHVKVDGVRVENTTYAGGEFKRCYDIEGRGAAFQCTPSTDDEYGITVSNSQRGNLYMGATGGRHPISFGGGLYFGCVPTRNMRVYGGYFGNLGPTGSGDAHGNTQDIQWFGTLFANGLDIGGADHKWNQCVVAGNANSGVGLYLGEPVKGTFEFNQCLIATSVNPNAFNFGLVHLGNMANIKGSCRVALNQCEYRAPAETIFPIWMNISNGTIAPDIIVDGGINNCPGATQFVRLERSGGASAVELVKVRGVTGIPAGAYFAANASAGSLTVSRYDLPEQRGIDNVSIGTAASSYSKTVNFRNPYPQGSSVVVSLNKAGAIVGGKRATADPSGVSPVSFSAAISTCDAANFTSADTAGVYYVAGVATQ